MFGKEKWQRNSICPICLRDVCIKNSETNIICTLFCFYQWIQSICCCIFSLLTKPIYKRAIKHQNALRVDSLIMSIMFSTYLGTSGIILSSARFVSDKLLCAIRSIKYHRLSPSLSKYLSLWDKCENLWGKKKMK